MSSIPEDVVISIIARLPVKSLMRFKCVCKSWYALTRDQFFIQKHIQSTRSNSDEDGDGDNRLILINKYQRNTNIRAHIIVYDETDDDKSANIDIPPFYEDRYPHLIGSCNGIVCLTDKNHFHFHGEGATYLWNPATREYKALPPPIYVSYPSAEIRHYSYGLGFGFDAKTNDYKLFRIASSTNGKVYKNTPPLAEVYSLSSNSWRAKEGLDISLNFRTCVFKNSTYLKGVYYWWAKDADRVAVLLSFNMTSEVFEKTRLPHCLGSDRAIYCRVARLKGSVAAIVFDCDSPLKPFDIYLLMDKTDSTWVKHLSIGPLVSMSVFGFWVHGKELLLQRPGLKGIVSYNLESQEIRNILHADYGVRDQEYSAEEFFSYRETLVSLKT